MSDQKPESKYQEVYPRQAEVMCAKGATLEDLAELFGCSIQALYYWKKKYPAFKEAMARGRKLWRVQGTQEVESALKKMAVGFKRVVQKVDKYADIHEIEEEVLPNVRAQELWLKANAKHLYGDKQEINHTGQVQWNLVIGDKVIGASPSEQKLLSD